MKSPNTKSSDELQHEVRSQIRAVNRDIEEMQGRMTPGQVIDDAIFYPHGRSPAATLEHLKRNPVGTAFLSLGTLMLMEDESHQSMEANARVKLNQAKHRLNDLKDNVKSHMPHRNLEPGTAPSVGDIAKGKVHDLKDSFSTRISDIKKGLDERIPSREELKGTIQSKISDIKEGVGHQVENLKSRLPDSDQVKAQGLEFQDELQTRIDTGAKKVRNLDPFTYMALGAGLGAITGASLPVSEKERQFVDEKLQDKISTFNTDLQSAVNECTNILKDLVISDAKNFNVNLFR